MTKLPTVSLIRYALLCIPILIFSCKDNTAPDFPYDKEYAVKPTTKTFEFSTIDTIEWETQNTTKYNDLPSKKIQWDKLESKRVEIGFPYAGSSELPEAAFFMDSLPSVDYFLDSVPKEKLEVRVVNLGEPEIEEAGPLTVPPRGTRGLQSFEEGFGLPNDITCSTVTRDGSIWIGGKGGYIAKYDSSELFIYGQDQGIELNNDIYSIREDSKGMLWVTSAADRVLVIDPKAQLIYELISQNLYYRIFEMRFMKDGTAWFRNNKPGFSFIDFENKTLQVLGGKEGSYEGGWALVPLEDHQGLIWTTTTNGIKIIDRKNNKVKTIKVEHGLADNAVFNLYEDKQNRMWISTGAGINIISADRKSIRSLGPAEGLSDMSEIYSVFQAESGKFWFGTANGLMYSYDESQNLFEKYDTTNDRGIVFEIFEDRHHQIYSVIAQGGMYAIDQSSGQPANIDGVDGLDFNKVWATLVDKDGLVWLGTEDGLAIYNPKSQVVRYITEEDGLTANYIYNLLLDSKGRIWAAGSGRGISIIDPEKGEIRQIRSEEDLDGNRVTEVSEDKNGTFWFGGFDGEIMQYHLNSDELKVHVDSLGERVTDFASDKSNNLYVGTQGAGIHIIDLDTGIRKMLTTQSALVSDANMSLTFDNQGALWAAGLKGVERIDLKDMRISLFRKDQGLAANDIYAIAAEDGKVYMGNSRGVTILEARSVQDDSWNVYTIGKDQGMIETDISQNSFSFDSEGHLWAGANALMLNVFDPVSLDTQTWPAQISGVNLFDKKQSFFDQEYRLSAANSQDSIWSWKINAYELLSPREKDSLAAVQSFLDYSGVDPETNLPIDLDLNYDRNYLSFNFNSGQYKNRESVVYSYILEGVDKNWSKIASEAKSENYRDLPPGNYTFKVASKGYNNIWSDPAEFSFTILPPWWKTRWAYFLYFVLITTSVYAFIQYRQRWLKKENRVLEERVSHRTAQLKKTIEELENTQGQLIQSEKMASLGELTAGIAHEIQNPMNFINNFSEVSHELMDEMMEEIDKGEIEEAKEISVDIKQNLEKIGHHGQRASSIVRGMLEHSRNSSGQKEDIDINVLADEYLRLAYHGLRAKDKSFNAKFDTEFDDTIGKIEIIPQDMGRVMLNLINNAFYAVTDRKEKESDESYQPTVKVTTEKQKDQVKITVEDNGSGIPKDIKDKIFQPFFTTKPSGKGTGLGLSLTYDIITQGHGGALELDSEEGKGTVFTIYLPVKK